MSGITLVPLDATSECRIQLTDRAILTVSTDSPIVYLGNNDSTGIVDPYLGSRVVKVYKKGDKFFAYCLPPSTGDTTSGRTRLNGASIMKGERRELKLRDLLTLCSSDNRVDAGGDYCYRVESLCGGATGAASAAASTAVGKASGAAASVAAAVSAAAASLPKEIGDDCMCPICMEIMVEPRTVSPCGHSFCRRCLTGQTECAECRGPITSQVICRSLQNLIERLVALQANGTTVFEEKDFEDYKTRTGSIGTAGSSRALARSSKRSREVMTVAGRSARRGAPVAGEVIVCLDD
jgi:RING-type zinc-finger